MLQIQPARKSKRLVARCPPEQHEAFLRLADATGESAGTIIRSLMTEALDRARRGEPIVRGLTAGAPSMTTGG